MSYLPTQPRSPQGVAHLATFRPLPLPQMPPPFRSLAITRPNLAFAAGGPLPLAANSKGGRCRGTWAGPTTSSAAGRKLKGEMRGAEVRWEVRWSPQGWCWTRDEMRSEMRIPAG
jgi:hypothetical protein